MADMRYLIDDRIYRIWSSMRKEREDRAHKRYEIDGQTRSLAYWCRKYKIRQETVIERMGRGFSFKAALMIPKYTRVTPEEAEEMLAPVEAIIVGEIKGRDYLIGEKGEKIRLIE